MPQNLYKSILLKNSRDSSHHGIEPNYTYSSEGKNALCGDEVTLFIKVNAAGDVIDKVCFSANACAICLASSNILAKKVEGQSVVSAKENVSQFLHAMGDTSVSLEEDDEINALLSVRDYPARLRCATLSWETFVKALP